MSTFTNYPYSARWIIGILILLNISCLAALWIGRPQARFHGHNNHDRLVYRMEKELNLDESQSGTLKNLVSRHREERDELNKEVRRLRSEMMMAMVASPMDTAHANAIAHQLGEFTLQNELMSIRHFEELGSIYTPEQKAKLKKLLNRFAVREER